MPDSTPIPPPSNATKPGAMSFGSPMSARSRPLRDVERGSAHVEPRPFQQGGDDGAGAVPAREGGLRDRQRGGLI